MIQNFLKIALRNLLINKSSAFINVLGLSIGMAGSLIIFMFVFNETNYDRFHKNGDNIYKVYQHSMVNGEVSFDGVTPVPMAAALMSDYPEVINAVRMYPSNNIYAIVDNQNFNVKHALYVDSSFFGVFTFDLIHGDKATVLCEPRSVVLIESLAKKIFGKEDPIDEMIQLENDTLYFRVTGICKDPPENSHFTYEMLISMDAFWDFNSRFWLRNNLITYILLKDGFPYKKIEEKFPDLIKKYIGPQFQQTLGFSFQDFKSKGNYLEYKLQPIRDIHLDASVKQNLKPPVSRKYLYIFSLVGIFILLLAGINYINLSIVRSERRSREIGLRKVFGSSRNILIGQFLSDSLLVSFASSVVAIVLAGIMLPYFNRMTDLSVSMLMFRPVILFYILSGSAVIIGVFAGFYPAFLLSSFNPLSVLKNKLSSGRRGSSLRRILVVFQFFIAIVILTCTLVIYQQLNFIHKKDLGFDKEDVLVIRRANALEQQLTTFIDENKKNAGIVNITNSNSIPGFPNGDNVFKIEGRSGSETYVMQSSWVDYSYINTLRMKVIDGRDFTLDFGSDSLSVIINEAAVKMLELENPLGTRLMRPDENENYIYYTVIGVVKDFHFQSLHNSVQPFLMFIKTGKENWGGYLSIRLGTGDKSKTVQTIEDSWKQYTRGKPLEYSFLDEDMRMLYKDERRSGNLSLTFTILAIIIACLGLIGLISLTTEQRVKEIGLRKIMGASDRSIMALLSSETVKLIIIASLFAMPASWLFINEWLKDFAYKTELNPFLPILTSLIILCLSLLTIGGHILYAASRNPVDSLRYE